VQADSICHAGIFAASRRVKQSGTLGLRECGVMRWGGICVLVWWPGFCRCCCVGGV